MSARGSGKRGRRGGHGHGEHGADERWLLTYSDMITLLMALFMVLFSISSVNISKYQTLQKSLKAAFSGSILPGGRSIIQSGSTSSDKHTPATAEVPAIVPVTPNPPAPATPSPQPQSVDQQLTNAMSAIAAANTEQENFQKLKEQLDAFAKAHGFSNQVQTLIQSNGLVIRVLTDKLLFDSGSASLKSAGLPLLDVVAQLLNVDHSHPITVEGHTDNQPISSAQFPSNWELSTARATTVVRYLISRGVDPQRLAAAGYADLHPLTSNATPSGQARNRRVEILLQRINPFPVP